MPKMTHWNSSETIDVSGDKAAVYAAQGWVAASKGAPAPTVEAVTRATANEEPKPAAKKAPAKKAAKKAAKKS